MEEEGEGVTRSGKFVNGIDWHPTPRSFVLVWKVVYCQKGETSFIYNERISVTSSWFISGDPVKAQ